MGIKGLLPILKDIQENKKLKHFSGETVGVDAFCWLHRGAYSCAKQLVLGEPTKNHINFVLKRIQLLLQHNIKPILVFDGANLPAKSETSRKRKERREEKKKMAIECEKKGDKRRAYELYQQAVNITHEMVAEVIKECKAILVSCIVAPFEADAQLAYLFRTKKISLAITEDSDLLVFGCTRVLFKLDSDGAGVLIDLTRLNKCKLFKVENRFETLFKKFQMLCILLGCDYLENIKLLGAKTAIKLVASFDSIEKLIEHYRKVCKKVENIPENYIELYKSALNMFNNMLVFDPKLRKLISLSGEVPQKQLLVTADKTFDLDQVCQVVLGNLCPLTLKPLSKNKFAEVYLNSLYSVDGEDDKENVQKKTINESTKTKEKKPKEVTRKRSEYFMKEKSLNYF